MKIVHAIVIAAIAVTVAGCAANPVTGEKELVLISTQGEIDLGRDNYLPLQQAEGGLYTADPALSEYVASVGRRVAAVSDRALPYQFVVLNNDTPNAWALPGGKIAINRGLLLELENEAELAAVLGHEVVHAAARHGARARQRGMLFDALLIGAALAGKDSEYANYIVGGAQVGLQLVRQGYSRDAERAADYHGMKYMRAAGYNPAAAVTLQEKFVALSKDRKTNWLEGLFATHPPSTERVVANREALADFPTTGDLGEARYRQHTAYLRAHRGAYLHAARARQLLDTDSQSALDAINNAIAGEPREPMFYGIKGHILARRSQHRQAVREYDAAIERDADYYEYFLGRGLAYNHLGERRRARADLERSNRLLPTAVAAYNLGGIALAEGDHGLAKSLYESAGEADGDIGNAARNAFVKLDIADAPWRYVEVEILFVDGEVVIQVGNLTAYHLADVVVGVNATINGQSVLRRPSLARLVAQSTEHLPSTVRYREEDEVEVEAQVLRARVAP